MVKIGSEGWLRPSTPAKRPLSHPSADSACEAPGEVYRQTLESLESQKATPSVGHGVRLHNERKPESAESPCTAKQDYLNRSTGTAEAHCEHHQHATHDQPPREGDDCDKWEHQPNHGHECRQVLMNRPLHAVLVAEQQGASDDGRAGEYHSKRITPDQSGDTKH